MRSVLISINKPHTDNIFIHKKKKVEWRKKPLPLTTNYCYETKNKGGCGKVIGQFDVVQNIEFDPLNHRLYFSDLIDDGCVSIEDLIEYANGDVIYGNVFENIRRYDEPKELSEFKRFCNGVGGDVGCRGCEYYYTESNESIGFYEECGCDNLRPLKRPPQSWLYVEGAD